MSDPRFDDPRTRTGRASYFDDARDRIESGRRAAERTADTLPKIDREKTHEEEGRRNREKEEIDRALEMARRILSRKIAGSSAREYAKIEARLERQGVRDAETLVKYCEARKVSKNHYYTLRASLERSLATEINRATYQDRNTASAIEAGRSLESLRAGDLYDLENLNRVSEYQPLPGRLRSKRQDRRPKGWQDRMIRAASSQESRERIATLALTGCRPAELGKGIRVEVQGDAIVFRISGAKKKEHGGRQIAGRDREITIRRADCPGPSREAIEVFGKVDGVRWVRTPKAKGSMAVTCHDDGMGERIERERQERRERAEAAQEIQEDILIKTLTGARKADLFKGARWTIPGGGSGPDDRNGTPSKGSVNPKAKGSATGYGYEGLRSEIRRAAERAGLDVTAYSFRHDFATSDRRAGRTEEEIAERMGHQSVKSQRHYGRPK